MNPPVLRTASTEPAAQARRRHTAPPRSARRFLVINPGSGSGRSRKTARLYRAMLTESCGAEAYDYAYTRTLDDATRLTRCALADGYDTVVAVGGDGTINRVISGFLGAGIRGARARLGVLYSGTSPDFCRFHGIPTAPAAAVRALLAGQTRLIDVCRIRHLDERGEARIDYFASSANIGLGAGIAARANCYRPRIGDFLGTLLASVVTIGGHTRQPLRLFIDGEEVTIAPALNITVGKNPHLASGLKLAADVVPDDGRLFVFAACGIGRRQLLWALPRLYTGSIARDRRFLLRRATMVRILPGPAQVRTEFDGDPAGLCPAEIGVLSRAIRLIGAGG